MALDTAIKNVGDYYAAHYLADKNGFAKDIRDQAKVWKEQGSQSAPRRLAALGDSYFKAKTAALDFSEPDLRSRAGIKELDAWHPALLDALGYRPEPFALELDTEKKQLPALLRLNRHNRPWLVILQAPFCLAGGDSDEEPLEQPVQPSSHFVEGLPTLQESWEKAIAILFKQEDAPRWVMLLAGARVYLFDAQTYAQGRYLWIDLEEAYGRRQAETFQAICALLSVDALAPEGETDEVLHERLREGSLKSTHGVSEKLQGAVRDAIQDIANGWVEARRQRNLGYRQLGEREEPLPDGSREITAEQLRHDALIYVYRLLFCFYAEARGGELGILPINDNVYRLGYSLEALRDLVDANEPGTSTEHGTYIAEHLERLFHLIYEGFDPSRHGLEQEEDTTGPDFGGLPRQESLFGSPGGEQLRFDDAVPRKSGNRQGYTPGKLFEIQPLTATLFDPAVTPLLSRVKLPNRVLHGVIRCLSVGTSHQSRRIGRINYAELGIVQLGSVYEGLLSYKGFFAIEDLIQVHQQVKQGKTIKPMYDDAVDPKQPTWFVPATRLEEFKHGEVVLEHRTEKPRIYRTGEFILHLNGVDRVNSASYYTPEVLTRTLVEEALKERLKDFTPEQADEVLSLNICEPAMGSAAFLVEAIDQLAHRYLELKQQQLGQNIDPSDYEDELRRVRHYIAVHNVYGVDLNPVAVELGALSLWLATIHRLMEHPGSEDTPPAHRPAATPWFGLRLRAGNSLIGARRSVWSKGQLGAGKHYGNNAQVPRQLKPGEARKPGEIYHFLVWDEDMAPAATDALMRQHWPAQCEQIKQWRNQQVKQKFSPEELARLEALSERIDALWADYAAERHQALAHSACTASVWPTPQNDVEALRPGPSLRHQERLKVKLEAESGAFQRLRLLMDSWCSFYFWPLEQAETLPSREAWLAAAEVLLGIGTDDLATRAMLDSQLGEDIDLEALFKASQARLPDAAHLSDLVPWFGVGRATAAEQHYHHWELIFTEVLGPEVQEEVAPKGFDLVFGNPPWLKVAWSDSSLLNEFEPFLGIRGAKSATYKRERPKLLGQFENRLRYRNEFRKGEGGGAFLNSKIFYPALEGVQTNLYKNFIEKSWSLIGDRGVSGLLHPEGVYEEKSGGEFRARCYKRLRAHLQFQNLLGLFSDVKANRKFSINLYGKNMSVICFRNIANLYHPSTLGQIYNVDFGAVPGLRDSEGKPELSGHIRRSVVFSKNELEIVAKLVEGDSSHWLNTRLLAIHDVDSIKVLEKIGGAKNRLHDFSKFIKVTPSTFFHETQAQGKYIFYERGMAYKPNKADDLVMVMGHLGIGNAFSKQALSGDSAQVQYEMVDAALLGKDYFPASIYSPDVDLISEIAPTFQSGRKLTDYYRYANRTRSQPDDTRTLISAILPKGVTHVHSILSVCFSDERQMVLFAGCTHSIVFDFFARSVGKENWGYDAVGNMPIIEGKFSELIVNRSLRLNCVAKCYADLWVSVAGEKIKNDSWTKGALRSDNFSDLDWSKLKTNEWVEGNALVSDECRRQALLEIDVLVAIYFGISFEELVGIYSANFSTFRKYDQKDLYDCRGQLCPSYHRTSPGRFEFREAASSHQPTFPITVTWETDSGNSTVTRTFYPPFSHVDRIEDYRTAYRVFAERLGIEINEEELA
ncbi:hypothetical protein [Thioalkalivibrio sp. ALE14]|uniref:hypothetical protein n=1 Tax=Thioalkalivibrio sp. ALE14 TaxID=1158168 RepID=UPI00037EB9FB|nr:hypothetical protein [Thioalkalivibrio sp. ALE14]